MKKKLLWASGLLLVALLAWFGRDLLGLYRLVAYIDTTTQAYEADGPWPQTVDACFGCHGARGSSLHQRYPSLAGQPAEYLKAQLHSFANGTRHFPNMQPLAMSLGQAEIDKLASYYARQTPMDNHTFQPDPALRQQGEQLAQAGACSACHGEKLMGQGPFPRLAGQGADYLQVQLDAFAQGSRVDPTGSMKAITSTLSAQDRKALAHYLAALAAASK
ncbi:c-type cytochrome [Pseudomonas mosselii]|uniref:c-type cytochrome n=1 Tax=Pseudomonas mosselii TaxID=78327 RepID=UPI00216371BB|nr:c-type cytochrome [Pseudomonas mosselii]MDH1100417.1 c-type cytochrome [Pseudomonas mosselii]MDH1658437.1 c-type cytochrome [Pseudomonas mosselii]MDH1718263.1 c-type cytochrome [Pseudomonas mosselii]MDH1723886.1 c-type cytochrome [Pseudomonas mosselii]MEB5931299.1 c-type cytochrome [Pseudomonas mosselii]